uniref:Uncharacterized protein n=1 Tax=Aegilops tauschii subsp. strangulata TaxID=200361 RepID=A0A453HPJ1_AEGTS
WHHKHGSKFGYLLVHHSHHAIPLHYFLTILVCFLATDCFVSQRLAVRHC